MKEIGPYTMLEGGTNREEVEQFIKVGLEKRAAMGGLRLSPGAIDRQAKEQAEAIFKEMEDKDIDHIVALFQATTKKDAESLAKGMTITISEFAALRLQCESLGYSHSDIYVNYAPADIDLNDLPVIIEKTQDGKIEKIGATPLSEGQLARVLNQRKRMHIHIFEKGKECHCLYGTFRDMRGEHGEMGEHLHYVSHLWGITKELLINNLTQKKHQSIGTHIKFVRED